MRSYLKNCEQKVNGKRSFSEWETILAGVPQGSIVDSHFLKWCFLVVTESHLSNYFDDNTLYCFGNKTNDANDKLRIDPAQVMEWVNENFMVLNADKWHYMHFGKNTENTKFYFDGNTCAICKEEKILGIMINNALLFDSHI